jgi:aspartate oxidase
MMAPLARRVLPGSHEPPRTARWCYTAALTRAESRGMHRRLDAPDTDPAFGHRLVTGGLDEIWLRPDPVTGDGARESEGLAS